MAERRRQQLIKLERSWRYDLSVKCPRSSGWHQDSACADLIPEHKLVMAWVALRDSREENA